MIADFWWIAPILFILCLFIVMITIRNKRLNEEIAELQWRLQQTQKLVTIPRSEAPEIFDQKEEIKKVLGEEIGESQIYSLQELSEKLNVSIRTLRDYVKRGELKAKKVGRSYYLTEKSLMAFIDDTGKTPDSERDETTE